METNTRRGFLALTIAPAAALTMRVEAASAPHPDATLTRLGHELDEAWTAQKDTVAAYGNDMPDEVLDTLLDRADAIVRQIEVTPARTMDGLKVKARAVSWCHLGEDIVPDKLVERPTTDVRIATAIVRELLAIGGAA